MPTISIDTFFACSIMVSVAVLATTFLAGMMQTRINSFENLNDEDYLRAISEYIVTDCGTPEDWGSDAGLVPETFGLAEDAGPGFYELNVDKICRLANENNYSLSYFDAVNSAKLDNIALGISLTQVLSISIELTGNSTLADSTTYTFMVSVIQPTGPINAMFHCFLVAGDYVIDAYNNTSDEGVGYVSLQIPNSENQTASAVVFARSLYDEGATAFSVYSFGHLSEDPLPNNSFLQLDPLNYTLHSDSDGSNTTIEGSYVFSYAYQFNLTSVTNTTYSIPKIADTSPLLLLLSGESDARSFNEWTAYPKIPLQFGADFSSSAKHVFTYIVIINKALFRLAISFGDVIE